MHLNELSLICDMFKKNKRVRTVINFKREHIPTEKVNFKNYESCVKLHKFDMLTLALHSRKVMFLCGRACCQRTASTSKWSTQSKFI